jgi:hypothetical protein
LGENGLPTAAHGGMEGGGGGGRPRSEREGRREKRKKREEEKGSCGLNFSPIAPTGLA